MADRAFPGAGFCPARENPFASDRLLAVRYRFPDGGVEEVLGRLDASGRRGAIVGPRGHGKTTALEDLAAALEGRGRPVRLLRLLGEGFSDPREARRCLEDLRPAEILFLDGTERLSAWGWRRFLWRSRRVGGIVATAHRPGLLPTILECRTSPALFQSIVEELVGEGGGSLAALTAELFAKHRGDLRAALWELYDHWADRGPALLPPPQRIH